MVFKKKDFIEIEFTGKTKDGEIFDSNVKKDLDKIDSKAPAKPFIFVLGEGMFLQGIDDFLIGKGVGEYTIDLEAKKAFGERNQKAIQLMPMKVFKEHKLNPVPGVMLNFDGRIAKIMSVSGGRVMVDFNNPLAGKDVSYKVKVLRKVSNQDEKIKSFIEFLFKKDLKFNVEDKKLTIEAEEQMLKFIELFSEKFKEVLELDLEVKASDEKPTKTPQ
jgi:FKBP-type peptidyl-prolyl cis-trans isomerase 2